MADKSQANAHYKQALAYARAGRWFLAELAVNRAERHGGITPKQRARLQDAKHRSHYEHNPVLDSIQHSQVGLLLWPQRRGGHCCEVVQPPMPRGAAYYDEQMESARKAIAAATGVPEYMLR